MWHCLKDQRYSEAIENSHATLEILQEKRSERAASEKAMFDAGSGKGMRKKDPGKGKTRLYPSLSELEESDISTQSLMMMTMRKRRAFMWFPLESIRKSLDRIKIKRKEREKQKQKQLESTRRSVAPLAPLCILRSWEQEEGFLSILECGRSERK